MLGLPSRAPVAVAFGVAALALVGWLCTAHPATASLGELSASQRAGLVERTLSNLREICRGGERPREFCREQARLVLEVPECRDECQAAAREELLADLAVR